jgi:hypothetical protein
MLAMFGALVLALCTFALGLVVGEKSEKERASTTQIHTHDECELKCRKGVNSDSKQNGKSEILGELWGNNHTFAR